MTRKHFEAIAEHMNTFWLELDSGSRTENYFDYLVEVLSDEFKAMNPNFDRARFKEAVYKED
jgi:hypothetical protein